MSDKISQQQKSGILTQTNSKPTDNPISTSNDDNTNGTDGTKNNIISVSAIQPNNDNTTSIHQATNDNTTDIKANDLQAGDNDNDNDNNNDNDNDIKNNDENKTELNIEQTLKTTVPVLDEHGERVLQRDIPNRIIVARGKKISFYYERARRILRLYDTMIVTGFGSTISVACSLVEVLKRNNMAYIINIETKTDYPINFITPNRYYNNQQQQNYYSGMDPQTAIIFCLQCGKYGKYLSGYHQRKIIELFEKYDKLTGVVSVKTIQSLKLTDKFYSNKEQIASAQSWLNNPNNLTGANGTFKLPDFIQYCSLIIHPLMKDNVFKRILYLHFKIGNYYDLNPNSNVGTQNTQNDVNNQQN